MSIKRMVLAEKSKGDKGGSDPRERRLENLENQIQTTEQALKNASEANPKSESVFGFKERLNRLKMEAERLKKTMSDRADREKEEKDHGHSAPGEDAEPHDLESSLVGLMDKHEETAVGINPQQNAQLEKMARFGWRLSGQFAVNDTAEGIAAVLVAPNNVAVLYPDGTIDRPNAREKTVKWRTGWYDPVAKAKMDERQRKAIEWFKKHYTDMLNLFQR